MGISFFHVSKPKSFQFKPRYYSEEKERVDALLKQISAEDSDDKLRTERMRENLQSKRHVRNSKNLITPIRLVIYAVLVVILVMLIYNASWLLR